MIKKNLTTEKTNLVMSFTSGTSQADEVKAILEHVSKDKFDGNYTDEVFEKFVENIIVNSRDELTFKLKCGLSLSVAGEQAGIQKTHSSMGLILKNINYLGNEVYPAIIDKETFDKAEEVRSKRAKDLGRIVELAAFSAPPPIERFKMRKSEGKLPDDPVVRAEYLYSLIESEV